MTIAADLAGILTRGTGPLSAAYVFGTESGRGSFVADDVVMRDEAGGTILVNSQVLRVPVAKLTTIARGDSITIADVSYTVKDVRFTGGATIREVFVT